MSLVFHTNKSNGLARYVDDPFEVAQDLLTWDPFNRQVTAFVPSFEVKETKDAFVLQADLPGVAEADLEITVANNILSITGRRQAEERNEGETYSLYERQFGSFSRTFALPQIADGEKMDAKLTNGVLTLTIAKKAEAQPRKIALKK